MLTTHFLFFLLNLVGFMSLGFIIAYSMKEAWKKLKKSQMRNVIIISVFAAGFGGLFGFLINGMPDIGFSMKNLMFASLFSILSIVPFISKLPSRNHN